MSEGIHDASGTAIASLLTTSVERDAHGNVQLSGTSALADLLCEEIQSKLQIKRVRGDTLGYLQRSFMGCVSDIDQQEACEVGEKAMQYAMRAGRDGSVGNPAHRRLRTARTRYRRRQDANHGGRVHQHQRHRHH